jgi:hypothetical protein
MAVMIAALVWLSAAEVQQGICFTGGSLSALAAPLGSDAATASMAAAADTGAKHLLVPITWYADTAAATSFAPYTATGSPLQSESDDGVTATVEKAASLGLSATLSCRLDLNWDLLPPGSRSRSGQAITSIGASLGGSAIDAWFVSYLKFATHVASLCAAHAGTCRQVVVADGLESMYQHATHWRALLAAVRETLRDAPGVSLVVSSSAPGDVGIWDAVDVIGVNALHTALFAADYHLLRGEVVDTALNSGWPAVEFGTVVKHGRTVYAHNVSLQQCQRACDVVNSHSGPCSDISYNSGNTSDPSQCYLWSHVVSTKPAAGGWRSFSQSVRPGWPADCSDPALLAAAWNSTTLLHSAVAASQRHGKPFVVTAMGYQSRPLAHRSPAGVVRPGGSDCSGWERCYDTRCQAALFSAFQAAWTGLPGFQGSYVWHWPSDPTAGGTSDSSFTPRGKEAEAVLRRWYGAKSDVVPPLDPFALLGRSGRGGSSATRASPAAGKRNGYVFGTGEWSNPAFGPTSPESFRSIDNAVTVAGVNALEFMVTWYFFSDSDTHFFPDRNSSSSTRTATDDELVAMMRYAKSAHNLTVAFTPFLDPYCNNWQYCAKQSFATITHQSVWRGSICVFDSRAQWAAFFNASDPHSYAGFILHYARLAERAGADEYFISHELAACVRHGPVELWARLLGQVRAVFSRTVTAALNWSPFLGEPEIIPPWLSGLDYLGIDCYFVDPYAGGGGSEAAWKLPPLQRLLDGWTKVPAGGTTMSHLTWVQALENYSRAIGGGPRHANNSAAPGMMPIVCTEVGYQSKPAPWLNPPGTDQPDDAACDVESLCVSTASQALAYEALFGALYPQAWFQGFYLWLWRADPSSGGMSDDQFGPQGKVETQRVLDKYWKTTRV